MTTRVEAIFIFWFEKKMIALCFLLRDGEKYLEKNLKSLISFAQKYLNDFRIFYIENDSVDNTKHILSHYSKKHYFIKGKHLNINQLYSEDMCEKTGIINCKSRVRFLAKLRQMLLDLVLDDCNKFTHMCMIDFDFISFDERTLSDMFDLVKTQQMDAIFGMSYCKTFLFYTPYDFGSIKPSHKMIPILMNAELTHVTSAFSGFGIYSVDSIRENKAKYNLECDEIEHIDFNKHFNRLYVYSKFKPVYDHDKTNGLKFERYLPLLICFLVVLALFFSSRRFATGN